MNIDDSCNSVDLEQLNQWSVIAVSLEGTSHQKRDLPCQDAHFWQVVGDRILIAVLPLESPIEFHYAEIQSYLEREGTLIGANDLLIAAHGLALNLTVVTANVRKFARVPNLVMENLLV
jgi:tRNA(fMet)-specific endonuclease VapC